MLSSMNKLEIINSGLSKLDQYKNNFSSTKIIQLRRHISEKYVIRRWYLKVHLQYYIILKFKMTQLHTTDIFTNITYCF